MDETRLKMVIKGCVKHANYRHISSGKALPTREEPKTVTTDSEDQDGEDLRLGKDQADKPLDQSLEQPLDLSLEQPLDLPLGQQLDLSSQQHHQLLQNQLLSKTKKKSLSLLPINHSLHFLAVTKKR